MYIEITDNEANDDEMLSQRIKYLTDQLKPIDVEVFPDEIHTLI